MNASQARKVLIVSYLKNNNFNPKRETVQAYFYLSPFRNETKSSFKVDKKLNVWFDFGSGNGGSIIDLVMQLENVTFKQALHIIENLPSSTFFSFHWQKNKNSVISIKHVQTLQNRALVQYIEQRQIPVILAKNFLKEVYYTVNKNDKQYFAIAFQNDKKGYELRNKYFKGSTSPKSYTSIKGNNNLSLNIFEGFFDFLSALHFFNTDKPNNDTIVLNSTSQIKKTLSILNSYKKVNLFLDNDITGKNSVKLIKTNHSNVTNQSEKIYPNHKDFNEFLIKHSL